MSIIIFTNSIMKICDESSDRYKVRIINSVDTANYVKDICMQPIHTDIKGNFHHPAIIEFHTHQPHDVEDATSVRQFELLKNRIIKHIQADIHVDVYSFEPTVHRKEAITYAVIGNLKVELIGYYSVKDYLGSYERYCASTNLQANHIITKLNKANFICFNT